MPVEQNRLNCKVKIYLTVCLLVVVTMTVPAWGQSIKELTINYIETVTAADKSANQVRVYASVTAADNNPVLGLSDTDFEILEDGRKVTVDDVSPATDPMTVVLAIDTSGSMQARSAGQTSMTAAKKAAVNFISMLSRDDRVALFSFNNEPSLKVDFTTDHDAAIKAVNALAAKPNAATCLYDTAFEAVQKAAEIPRGRRAIILLTDGKDEKAGRACSMHTANDVIDVATTKSIRVPIFTIGVGPKVDARELGRIASFTGGRNLLATSLSDLQGLYRAIANQLKNQYLITYITHSPSGEHTLVMKVQHAGARRQDEKRFWSPPLPVSRPLSISFVEPGTAEHVKGVVTVKTSIKPQGAIAKVRYYVGASLKEERATAPFDIFHWDTAGLPGGLHILRVEAIDVNGRTGSAEMTLKVAGLTRPAPPPAAGKDQRAQPAMTWIAGLVVLLALAGGISWWFINRQRQTVVVPVKPDKTTALDEVPAADIEDETVFMEDDQDLQTVPPAAVKVVESDSLEPGKSFKVAGTTLIGRSSDNAICIPDRSVSRKHGEIYFDDGRFYIRDLGSKNGIKVDEKRVLATGVTLNNGAKIQLAPQTILEFHSVALVQEVEFDDRTRRYDA
jgi:VWFA-related protein